MNRRRLLTGLGGFSVTGLAGCLGRCTVTDSPGPLEERTLTHDGRERRFFVFRPVDATGPLPTVLILHGGGGSAEQVERDTRFRELAASEGFVAVFPDGVDGNWNDLRSTDVTTAHREGIDDVGFLAAVIDRLVDEEIADRENVFCTGISNGGMMTLRLATERPDLLTGAMAVSANLPVSDASDLPIDPAPLPMAFVHGTADPLVPYDGGVVGFARSSEGRGRVRSADDTVAVWVDANGCDPKPTVTTQDCADDETSVEFREYGGGTAPVRHVVLHGGGHGWPGADSPWFDMLVGPTTQEVSGEELAWEFFAAR
ncbi:alpha/beta hydrolase family esterase [Haloarchaeobius sp. DFWS5]|uniref:alpha/beta hydrolase family esterase n=1 Tax=Haloarchaeobius sp. DFWS5 TaxID=3446114 RepID=UPI003EBE5F49